MTNKTGWPAPELAQDDDRKLFRWFASKPDARRRVREAADDLLAQCATSGQMDSAQIHQHTEAGELRRFPTRRVIPELVEAQKRGFVSVQEQWDRESVERPFEDGAGYWLAALFFGIALVFGVPFFIEVILPLITD